MSIYNPRTVDLFNVNNKRTDKNFKIQVANYFESLASNCTTDISDIDNLIYGYIDKSKYKWLLNPYNATDDRFKRYPGELKNMDIIMPVIRRYVGEYIKSFNVFHVISKLPNEDNEYLDELNKFVINIITKKANAQVNKAMKELGDEEADYSQEEADLSINEEIDKFELRWKDQRALIDAELLEFLRADTDDDYLYTKAYTYWVTYGQYYVDRYIENDNVIKDVLHPGQVFPVHNATEFIEDYSACVIRHDYDYAQILSKLSDYFDKKDLDYLGKGYENFATSGNSQIDATLLRSHFVEESINGNKTVPKTHFVGGKGTFPVRKIYFKGYESLKILTYLDVLGNEQEVEVEMDYVVEEEFGDISVEVVNIPTVFMQYHVGEKHTGVYSNIFKVDVQRTNMDNVAICKLPITGKFGLMHGLPNHSIVKILEPYQKTINMLYLARERAMAKNHGRIGVFPKGLLGNDTLKEEETMYRMTASNLLFADETSPNFAASLQGLKSIDLSDYNYISSLSNLINETKTLAAEAADMNRQRAGDTYASDGKFTTEQAIIRSSLGTALTNDVFNKSRCKDYEADIDFTKKAWIKGKRGKYISSDRKVRFFEINDNEHSTRQYGIFVDSSAKINDKYNKLEAIALGAAQNGAFSVALETIDNENYSKLKEIVLKYEQSIRKREEDKGKAEQENAKRISEGTVKAEQVKQSREDARADEDNRIKLLLKEVDYEIAKLKTSENSDYSANASKIAELESTIADLERQREHVNK